MSDLEQTDIDFDRHEELVDATISEMRPKDADWEHGSMRAAIQQVSNGRTQIKAAEDYEFGQPLLSKYINAVLDNVEEFESEQEDTKFSGAGPAGGPFDDDSLAAEYINLEPDEFIREFFEDFEVGVRKNFIEIQGRRARRHDGLPTKDSLFWDLVNMNSGISDQREADYIATEFWAEAQKYLQLTNREPMQTAQGRGVQQNLGQGQGGQGQFVGGGQPSMGGQPGDPQQQMFQMMFQQMQQLQEEIQAVKSGSSGTSGGQSTVDRLEELKREKELIEDLSGGGERVEQIEQQMQQLWQRFQEGAAQEGQARGVQQAGSSMEERLLAMAVKYDDVDLPEVMEVLDKEREVEKHPEVLEKQYEKEMREMELEREDKRYEKFGELFERVSDQLGRSIGDALVGGDDEEQSPSQPPAREQPQTQPATQQPQEGPPCKHCETPMLQGPGGSTCPQCGYGVANCDIPNCGQPVEIPPEGQSAFGLCPDCNTGIARGDAVECEMCGWSGAGDELFGEALLCDSCGNIRPIDRRGGMDAMEAMADGGQ